MVYDKDTGRPKGYGFAEFADADAAASAVRNLNDYEIMGRKIKVDWSKDNGAGDHAPPDHVQNHAQPAYPPMNMNGQPPAPAQAPQPGTLGPLPPGADLPPNLTCPDAISRTLSTLPAPQLLDILSQMKGLVMTDPAKATELLRQAPQLAYAIFQSLLLLELVDGSILGSLIENSAVAPTPVAQPPPMQQQQQPAHVARPPMNYPGYPPQVPTPQPQAHMPQPYAQPPQQHQPQPYAQPPKAPPQPYAQPPQAQPQPPAQAPPMDQQAMYAQVMALTPDQIAQLAPEQQQQILQLRQFLMAGGRP